MLLCLLARSHIIYPDVANQHHTSVLSQSNSKSEMKLSDLDHSGLSHLYTDIDITVGDHRFISVWER